MSAAASRAENRGESSMRHVLGDDDLVVLLERIPVDVEEVLVLVRRVSPGTPLTAISDTEVADLVVGHPEVLGGLLHRDAVVFEQPRHEREQEGELVAGLRRRHRLRGHAMTLVSHGRPPSSSVAR